MTTTIRERIYHNLVITADHAEEIWLVCDQWHLVQHEVGKMKTSVLEGRYYVELGKLCKGGKAYVIDLLADTNLTSTELRTGPFCVKQPPQFPDVMDSDDPVIVNGNIT